MSTEPTIKCPKCGAMIELAKSMAGPIMEKIERENAAKIKAMREHADEEIRQLKAESISREEDMRRQLEHDAEDRAARLVATRLATKDSEFRAAKEQLEALSEELKEKDTKLMEAQRLQAEIVKKERALADAQREMELTIQKKITEELDGVRTKAKWEAESAMDMKVKEKEQTIASMQATIAELKQKAEQGSMQTQGEVQELEIEKTLRAKFPTDVIAEVPKGINGADCVQEVKDNSGKLCGMIVWESKRTKAWSDGWLPKLREDQRTAKADLAILVTQTLPKDMRGFGFVEGVWVCSMDLIVPIATILRQSLLEVSMARGASEGQATKMEILYTYLTGMKFRTRVQAIVEAFTTMQEDLLKEKKAITKSWAKREEQLTNVMESTVGMYGDIQGIAGKAIKEIDGLEIRQISQED